MNLLRLSSLSLSVKIFVIFFVLSLVISAINAPLSVAIFNDISLQSFQQVVTESALRQKQSIEEDIGTALSTILRFKESSVPLISVSQWLLRADPTEPDFSVDNTRLATSAERAIVNEIMSVNPTLYKQAWLIRLDGKIILNTTNLSEPRFTITPSEFVDAGDLPAYRAGLLLSQSTNVDRPLDIVVEELENSTSIQVVTAIFDGTGSASGILVVELNNTGIILSNVQSANPNSITYSFVASPNSSPIPIALEPVLASNLVNLNTQALRSSLPSREASSYVSGDRRVLGYHSPIFDDFRNDIIFVVELDETNALSGVSGALLTATLPTIIIQALISLIAVWIIDQMFIRPIRAISETLRATSTGDFTSPLPVNRGDDEVGVLAETVIELRQQIQSLTQDMEARIEARSRDLQVTQDIGRAAISQSDLDSLMNSVINLITERFNRIYHAQIFLIEGSYAVLKASTGTAGQQLLRRGHRLAVGSLSVIGQVTLQNQTIIARDTTASEVHSRNEFLKDTRSELAIPMRIGNRTIGVLDVQSKERDSFDDNLVAILETMTDQIAMAIENTRLYEESTIRLKEMEHATRHRLQQNWEDFMYSQRTNQMMTQAGAQNIFDFTQLRDQASQSGKFAIGEVTERDTIPVAIPIVIRDQVLGVIEWELAEADFNRNRLLLAEELASRLAVSLDNARLVQASQQSVENERVVNTISAKISGQTDIEQILQTAIREVGQALRAPRVNISLNQSTSTNGNHENGKSASNDN